MRRAACLACFVLACHAVPTPVLAVSEEPAEFTATGDRGEWIRGLLERGEWAPAEAEARTGLAEDVKKNREEDLVKLLTYLAVAEEGLGRHEDAAWHWQEVRAMTETADLSPLGAPAEALAKLPVRRMDEAPAGLAVRREGDGGPPLTPARWVSGEEARLAARDKPIGIRVQAIVDAEGRMRQPVVAASTSPILTYAALEAMRGWRFTPAQAEGRPIASFYELKVPPAWPLDRIVALSKSLLAGPLELLKQGRYAQAEKKIAGLWQRARYEQSSDQSAAFFGVAMLEKALAAAGLGREDAAVCRYQAAQTLEPHLYSADLSDYGAAGALLMQHPWGSERRSVRWVGLQPKVSAPGRLLPGPTLGELLGPTQEAVTRPAIVSRRNPDFPEYARRFRLDGTVIVESIITERGTPREMLILKPSPTPGFDASALDALCDWRFKPATWRGRPVKVYYKLTVNFEVQR